MMIRVLDSRLWHRLRNEDRRMSQGLVYSTGKDWGSLCAYMMGSHIVVGGGHVATQMKMYVGWHPLISDALDYP